MSSSSPSPSAQARKAPNTSSSTPAPALNRSSSNHSPKNPIKPTPAANKRHSALNPVRSNSLSTHHSADDLERERAKVENLKALISAAEEKEADAQEECSRWRSKVDQLSATIDRMEAELVKAQDTKANCERMTKELEKLKATYKEHERSKLQQLEDFEASKAAWAEEEANLRSKLSTLNAELVSLQKQYSSKSPDEQESEGSLRLCASPDPTRPDPNSTLPPQSDHQTSLLSAELKTIKEQYSSTQASMEQALATVETLKAQLADLERVNEQLMDDNESYQFLVGERTLMGGFDVKQLLRVDVDTSSVPTNTNHRRFSPSSSSTPSLEGVEEEDEEEQDDDDDDDADAVIERAVLESHGNGTRTTGAVEAGISNSTKPKLKSGRRNEPGGMGLDLAAELAQAEDQVEENRRRLERQEQRKAKKVNKDRDQEIKALQDTNKALVLYISKILDRISAHDGFEKVLSSDYPKDANKSPSKSSSAANTSANGTKVGTSVVNPAPKRTSWLQYFTSLRSPSVQSTAIKPLRLGAATTTGSGGGSGTVVFKDRPESEDTDEEACARERRIAEMKLHGLNRSGTISGETGSLSNAATIRANRRSTSMYGVSTPLGISIDKTTRRNSGESGKFGVGGSGGKSSLLPSFDSSSVVPLSQVGLIKRNEEREKESKMNLEKGQASGFTEIEIRGHRMRPSSSTAGNATTHQRQSTTPNYPLSPDLRSIGSSSPSRIKTPTPTSANTNTTAFPGGIKDLKMTSELANHQESVANEGLLARTARRISMMGGGASVTK